MGGRAGGTALTKYQQHQNIQNCRGACMGNIKSQFSSFKVCSFIFLFLLYNSYDCSLSNSSFLNLSSLIYRHSSPVSIRMYYILIS